MKDPAELDVVFPNAVSECVCTDCVAEMVALPAPTPTLTIPAPERLRRLENVPAELLVVFPRAVNDCVKVCTDAEMVIVDAALPIPIPAPAEMLILPLEPFSDVTTFVAAGAGTEMVTLPFPTPTEAIPAPEKFSKPEKVPAELEVVLPSAVRDCENVCTEAEIVIVDPACPVPMPAPALMLTLDEVPFRLKLVAAGMLAPEIVMT